MKGGPSAGPPFAFDQGSDFQVCAGVALPVPRPTKKMPEGVFFVGADVLNQPKFHT